MMVNNVVFGWLISSWTVHALDSYYGWGELVDCCRINPPLHIDAPFVKGKTEEENLVADDIPPDQKMFEDTTVS